MNKYLKFYFYLPLFFLYLFLLVSFYPTIFIIKLVILSIFIFSFASIYFLIKQDFRTDWPMAAEFTLFSLSSFLFLLSVASPFLRYIFLIFFLTILGLFLFFLSRKKFSPRLYKPGSLEKVDDIIQGLIIFTALVNLDFARLFYNFPFILVLGFVFLLFIWIFYYSFHQFDFIFGLISVELYLSLSFFPFQIYLNSLIFLMLYYIINYLWFGKQKKLLGLKI